MLDGFDLGKRRGNSTRQFRAVDQPAEAQKPAAFVAPIGWHGFPAPRHPPVKTIILTGQPPLEVQLRGQVRSATGMTWGQATIDGAKMRAAFAFGRRNEREG